MKNITKHSIPTVQVSWVWKWFSSIWLPHLYNYTLSVGAENITCSHSDKLQLSFSLPLILAKQRLFDKPIMEPRGNEHGTIIYRSKLLIVGSLDFALKVILQAPFALKLSPLPIISISLYGPCKLSKNFLHTGNCLRWNCVRTCITRGTLLSTGDTFKLGIPFFLFC